MLRIVVINSKGGCGKTTISTNLASFYAASGHHAALFDYDPQGSSMRWLRSRPAEEAGIYGVTANQSAARATTMSWHLRLPPETGQLIIDTPPGLKGSALVEQIKGADCILIPVLPSPIDIFATADFIRDLLLEAKVRQTRTRIGIIANRVRKNTLAFQALERFLRTLSIPVVARLRDSQNYVKASEEGLGIHELKNKPVYVDKMHWRGICDWIEQRPSSTVKEKMTEIEQPDDEE
ncbi:MAG: chromosome partitioning protein [Pseudomonadota bacterium]|nr:chromosome partitioning protein [Pseudomonadota bacterium]